MNTTNKTAVEEIVKRLWSVTGESQYKDKRERELYRKGFGDAVAMTVIELTGTPKSKGLLTLAHQQGERDGVERCIPEEKPMNTFSFVLKGEELELYNQHKGWNKCREAMKALQPLPDKE